MYEKIYERSKECSLPNFSEFRINKIEKEKIIFYMELLVVQRCIIGVNYV